MRNFVGNTATKFFVAVLMLGSLGGVAAHADTSKPVVTQDMALAALTAADAEAQKADAAGVQWTTVPTLLKAAHFAYLYGDYSGAAKKAGMAEAQAKTALTEAKEQASLWQTQVIR
ncbi:MAG: hypothetical protein B7Y73_03435 [Acidocella sp. 35-58-6]|nr:MAG: hypothetical protein B7Y73_03435 [Acidocella sp. 35-58-6]